MKWSKSQRLYTKMDRVCPYSGSENSDRKNAGAMSDREHRSGMERLERASKRQEERAQASACPMADLQAYALSSILR